MMFRLFLLGCLSPSSVLADSAKSTLSLPSIPSPSGISSEIYTVRSSSGKGLGVFALTDLEIGAIIIAEPPILTIKRPSFKKGTGYPLRAVSQLVGSEFALLSPLEQEEIQSLTYHDTSSAQENESSDKLGLIFKSNAYKTGDEIGLFPKIARINHSCRPNTSYYWNAKLSKRIVYANRKISKGEELFDSYISLLLTQEERQAHLEPYGFACSCEACAVEKKGLRESDQRRREIKKAFGEFDPELTHVVPESKSAKKQARKDARASLKLVELVELEGLADFYANAYKIAAISHARVQDWGAATKWANKGYELRVMEDPESGYAAEMYELTSKYIERWKSELRDRSMLKDEI